MIVKIPLLPTNLEDSAKQAGKGTINRCRHLIIKRHIFIQKIFAVGRPWSRQNNNNKKLERKRILYPHVRRYTRCTSRKLIYAL